MVRIDEEDGALIASFDGREVSYPFGELDTLVPCYATTIHKSQGSEYPAVIIPVVTQHYTMLARNLLYTGVTRGKRLVILVGQRKALGIVVRGGQTTLRPYGKSRKTRREADLPPCAGAATTSRSIEGTRSEVRAPGAVGTLCTRA